MPTKQSPASKKIGRATSIGNIARAMARN